MLAKTAMNVKMCFILGVELSKPARHRRVLCVDVDEEKVSRRTMWSRRPTGSNHYFIFGVVMSFARNMSQIRTDAP